MINLAKKTATPHTPAPSNDEFPATALDYLGRPQPIPWPADKKLVARVGSAFLLKTGSGRFAVVYNLHARYNLAYNSAARELGLWVLHQAQCDGLLD